MANLITLTAEERRIIDLVERARDRPSLDVLGAAEERSAIAYVVRRLISDPQDTTGKASSLGGQADMSGRTINSP